MKHSDKKQSKNNQRETESRFDHRTIELLWRNCWERIGLDITDIRHAEKPFYNLMMFPYPSAEGLHVGNMYAFTGSDIYGRYKRMKGYDVFEPIGLDGFGIHSENYALRIGRHPMDHAGITEKNFYNQLKTVGAMFDWSRTVETYNPEYYRWTQWLFVQMFKKGLAYRGHATVNWCPGCKTVLADEQVIDGFCERCGNKVYNKLLDQWFFRITAYAGKLLENISSLNWSEKVKVAQKNWIGRSEGINFKHKVKDLPLAFEVYDSVPQTFLAQTFVVIAPEHPFLEKLVKDTDYEKPVMNFVARIKQKKLLKSFDIEKETEGIFTGRYSENYMGTGRDLPIWVASFALVDYGTGIVGCSAHDQRDFIFAKKYDIPLKIVLLPPDGDEANNVQLFKTCYHHAPEGIMQEPEVIKGMKWIDARKSVIDYIKEKGFGRSVVNYHLRDWLISRQRYWGPPIPMIYCELCKEKRKGEREDMPGWWAVPEKDLPVVLPRIEDYKPGDDGVAPLAKHKEFYETVCPGCGGKAVREKDVSDTFLDSSWYFLRYPSISPAEAAGNNCDPSSVSPAENDMKNPIAVSRSKSESGQNFSGSPRGSLAPWDSSLTKKWLPVSMYTGGAEHSVLHLLYSRFVVMALHDMGYIDFDEPFAKFFAHGLVIKDGAKMSKSKGNVVNPDEYIDRYGVDSLRLYLMFMGPFDQGGDFRDSSMEGMSRWVGRVWRIGLKCQFQHSISTSATIRKALQYVIKKVGGDIERRHYNTAIAAMMEFTNTVTDEQNQIAPKEFLEFVKILAPFAPYLAEELWQQFADRKPRNVTKEQSIHLQHWPEFDTSILIKETSPMIVQVGGKFRDTILVPTDRSKQQSFVEVMAMESQKVRTYLVGKTIVRVVFIPDKVINFVLK